MGRPTETVAPTGAVTRTIYDELGREIEKTDAMGNVTRRVYDDQGWLWKVVGPLGDVTEFRYDERGNRTMVVDANGGVTTRTYDLKNRLISETNPLGAVTSFLYDGLGQKVSLTDGNGGTTMYEYTPNRKFERIVYPDGSVTEYRYDVVGRKVFEANADVSIYYEYDDVGRLVAYRQVTANGVDKTLRFEFDEDGNRIKLTNGEGRVTKYEYDRNRRLTKVIELDGSVTRLEYDAAGRRTKAIYPNGVWAKYGYDAAWRVAAITYRSRTNETLAAFEYSRDLNGNPVRREFEDGTDERYAFDAANRLVEASYPDGVTERFAYDALGNRVRYEKDSEVWNSTFNAFNQLTSSAGPEGTTSYSWDGNGNLVGRHGPVATTYVWTSDNRLRAVVTPAATVEYSYRPDGIRVGRVAGSTQKTYLLDGRTVLSEYDGDGRLTRSFSVLGADEVSSFSLDDTRHFRLVDALGSTYATVSDVGSVSARFDYRAYGQEYGPQQETEGLFWQGREKDNDLYYFRARYYSIPDAMFISADPLPEMNNKYFAMNGNPVAYTDPSGMAASLLIGPDLWSQLGSMAELYTNLAEVAGADLYFEFWYIGPKGYEVFRWPEPGGGALLYHNALADYDCNPTPEDCGYYNMGQDIFFITDIGLDDERRRQGCKNPYLCTLILHEWVHVSIDKNPYKSPLGTGPYSPVMGTSPRFRHWGWNFLTNLVAENAVQAAAEGGYLPP